MLFQVIVPADPADCVALLRRYDGDAAVLAGGTDLLVALREDRVLSRVLVNIKGLHDLQGITHLPDGGLHIGAGTKVADLLSDERLAAGYPSLVTAAACLGSVQIRNVATIGGNICWSAPSADLAPPFLALDAVVQIRGSEGTREMLLRDFFLGPRRNALGNAEILTSIVVPGNPAGRRRCAVYNRYSPRRALDLAVASVAVCLHLEGSICREARIAMGAVAPIPMRAGEAERLLRNSEITPETVRAAGNAAAAAASPITDIRGTAEYRRHMIAHLTSKGILECLGTRTGETLSTQKRRSMEGRQQG